MLTALLLSTVFANPASRLPTTSFTKGEAPTNLVSFSVLDQKAVAIGYTDAAGCGLVGVFLEGESTLPNGGGRLRTEPRAAIEITPRVCDRTFGGGVDLVDVDGETLLVMAGRMDAYVIDVAVLEGTRGTVFPRLVSAEPGGGLEDVYLPPPPRDFSDRCDPCCGTDYCCIPDLPDPVCE